MYTMLCVYFYLKRKDQILSLTVNYSRVLNTMFEQNKKEIKVGWRKLFDMELHELYHLIETSVTNWRATVTIGTEPQTTSKRRAQTWEVYRTRMHDRKSAFVSALLEEFKCWIFEHSLYCPDLAPGDYHLFLCVKKFLAGQRLRCDQDRKHVLQDWLEGLAANLFEEGIQKLVPR